MMRSHLLLKPSETQPPPFTVKSKTIRLHTVPLRDHLRNTKMEQVKLLHLSASKLTRVIQNVQKPTPTPLNRAQRQTTQCRMMSGAGTEFLTRPTTCWTNCWISTQPPGLQPPRPCSTRCSKTCETTKPGASCQHTITQLYINMELKGQVCLFLLDTGSFKHSGAFIIK